jgi:insecticidal toxin complex protein TccC
VYEVSTQRLSRLSAQRERDATVLQDLSYTYDPVGNITRIEDAAQPVHYTRNQRVEAASDYRYDALYQLVQATGRESAQASQQSAALPLWQSLDATQRVNYTRQYTYDASGNLCQMQHTGAQHYTLRMVVAAGSNRAVPEAWDVAPEQVDRYFDANGNLTQLQPGQPVGWNTCDQLSRVVQIERGDNESDDERYAYSSAGQRARKVRRWRAGSQQHSDDVRYLPGLERREHRQADVAHPTQSNVTEALQVVVVDASGIALRVMHWEAGKPEQINNDQARYSLDNQLGSSTLELDDTGQLLTYEEYYPYGGTAVWAAKSELEAKYKYARYSGKERDATGLYYYGYRYYMPWLGRWLNPDPARIVDGLNLYQMVKNSPILRYDDNGLMWKTAITGVTGVAGVAYEAYKHRQKLPAHSEAEIKAREASKKTYGDRKADEIINKIGERKDKFDISIKIEEIIIGRVKAVGHVAQGKVPGVEALKTGVDTVATVGEFAATGDVKQVNKTALTKAAATDAYNNLGLSIEAVKRLLRVRP